MVSGVLAVCLTMNTTGGVPCPSQFHSQPRGHTVHLQGERAVQVAYLSMCGLQESGAHQTEVLLASQPRLLVAAAPPATAKDCLAEDVEDSEKEPKLTQAPSYMKQAAKKKLKTSILHCPRQRCMINTLSQTTNLMDKHAVLNMSQSLNRNAFRKDGLIPTMTTQCNSLCFPAAAAFITVEQLMLLMGFNPGDHREAMEEIGSANMAHMLGNAMPLPVVGLVATLGLSMLGP